jgi:serine O-acetyltransferase
VDDRESHLATWGGARERFRRDRARYPRDAWLTRRSLWAIAAYRFAQATTEHPPGLRTLTRPLSAALTLLARVATNIELPTAAEIGPGLRIGHAGPIVVAGTARIGAHCSMGVGVVIGTRGTQEAPTIGDGVKLGAYAVVLGPVTVGDGASVGAMSLVLRDVPAGVTVAGNPARPLHPAGERITCSDSGRSIQTA